MSFLLLRCSWGRPTLLPLAVRCMRRVRMFNAFYQVYPGERRWPTESRDLLSERGDSHNGMPRFDVPRKKFHTEEAGLWGASITSSMRTGIFLSQSICGTSTWTPNTAHGHRACLRMLMVKIV